MNKEKVILELLKERDYELEELILNYEKKSYKELVNDMLTGITIENTIKIIEKHGWTHYPTENKNAIYYQKIFDGDSFQLTVPAKTTLSDYGLIMTRLIEMLFELEGLTVSDLKREERDYLKLYRDLNLNENNCYDIETNECDISCQGATCCPRANERKHLSREEMAEYFVTSYEQSQEMKRITEILKKENPELFKIKNWKKGEHSNE